MKVVTFGYSILALLLLGIAYAWSLFTNELQSDFPQWTTVQISTVFSVTMISFCFAGLVAGKIGRVINQSIIITICGVLFFVGMLVTSYTQSKSTLYLFYGIINGFATGLCYNTIISNIPRLYNKSRNFITGILMMSYGMSSMILGPIIEWSNSSAGWRMTFKVMAYVYLMVMLGYAAIMMKIRNYCEDQIVQKDTPVCGEITLMQALSTKPIWLYYAWGICTACVGLGAIGHISQTAMEVTGLRSMAVIATGLLSVSNGMSRVIFGTLYDKFERKISMRVLTIVGALGVITICSSIMYKVSFLLLTGAILLGAFYGGAVPINSAFVREYYGEKYFSENFGFVCSDGLISSLLGPTLVSYVFSNFGSYFEAYAVTSVYIVVAVILEMILTADYKKRQVKLSVFLCK